MRLSLRNAYNLNLTLAYPTVDTDIVITGILNSVTGKSDTNLARRLVFSAARMAGCEPPDNVRIYPVCHHLAHAASSYYFSGFNNCAGLVVDGSGEAISTSIWEIKNGEFEAVASIPVVDWPLGLLYESVSEKLGFTRLEGPGKVMGLAPYGTRAENIKGRFSEIERVTDLLNRGLKEKDLSLLRMLSKYESLASSITGGLNLDWNPRGELNSDVCNVAFELQDYTERAMVELVTWAKHQCNDSRLILSGGVALNAKSNMVIQDSKFFQDIFIFPAANDAGSPVGAAAFVSHHVLGERPKLKRLDSIFLGPAYPEEEVEAVIRNSKRFFM